jgi:hypothetical protein
MRVRFARWFAGTMTAIGGAGAVIGVLAAVEGSAAAIPFLIGGGVIALFGLLYFGPIPYVIVSPSQVELSMTRGPRKRTTIRGHEHLDTDGDQLLVVGADGDVRRLPAHRSMAHAGDWIELVATFTRR